MKYLLALLGCFVPLTLLAQVNKKVDETVAALAVPYVPSGWKTIDTANGDLNKDGADDIAVVIENTTATGNENTVANARQLLILFKDKEAGNYYIVAKNESVIPTRYDAEKDIFTENGNVSIKKGRLNIYFGRNLLTRDTYTLCYLDNDFRLTHFQHSVSGLSGDDVETGIDFLAGKKTVTIFADIFGNKEFYPQTDVKKIELGELLTLSELKYNTTIAY